jgi:hypothetical protein
MNFAKLGGLNSEKVIRSVGWLLSFDPVINLVIMPIINNLPVDYWFFNNWLNW